MKREKLYAVVLTDNTVCPIATNDIRNAKNIAIKKYGDQVADVRHMTYEDWVFIQQPEWIRPISASAVCTREPAAWVKERLKKK